MNSVMRLVCVYSIILLLPGGAAVAFSQIPLTDVNGQTLECEILSASKKEIKIRASGRTLTVTERDLQPDSWTKAQQHAKDNGLLNDFPELEVNVRIATRRRDVSWYVEEMTISPKFTLEGRNSFESLPAMEASVMVITMDMEMKYRYRQDAFFVEHVDTVEVPEAERGEKREFEFRACKVEYDVYRDTSNIGGRTYKYYLFVLQDPATGRVVHYETNYRDMETVLSVNPQKAAEYLNRMPKGEQIKLGEN